MSRQKIPQYAIQKPQPFFKDMYEIIDEDRGVGGEGDRYSYPMGNGKWMFTSKHHFALDKLPRKPHIKIGYTKYLERYVSSRTDPQAILRMTDSRGRKHQHIYKAFYASEAEAPLITMYEFIASFVGMSPFLYDIWYTPADEVDHEAMVAGGIRPKPGLCVVHIMSRFITGGSLLDMKKEERIPYERRRVLLTELHLRAKHACLMHEDYAYRNIVYDIPEDRCLYIDWERAALTPRAPGASTPFSWNQGYDAVTFTYPDEPEYVYNPFGYSDYEKDEYIREYQAAWMKRMNIEDAYPRYRAPRGFKLPPDKHYTESKEQPAPSARVAPVDEIILPSPGDYVRVTQMTSKSAKMFAGSGGIFDKGESDDE